MESSDLISHDYLATSLLPAQEGLIDILDGVSAQSGYDRLADYRFMYKQSHSHERANSILSVKSTVSYSFGY